MKSWRVLRFAVPFRIARYHREKNNCKTPTPLLEIKAAIEELPENDVRQLSIWLQDYLDEMWDRQMETDLASGRLNDLIAKAEADIAANQVRDLDEVLQGCKRNQEPAKNSSLQLLIDEYAARWGDSYEREDRWWGDKTLTWEEAMTRAWKSRFENGKMHGHQRRVANKLLEGLEVALADGIKSEHLKDFQSLYDWVKSVTNRVKGLGATTAYDVARRLGAWLKLKPSVVYLHAGTAAGARKFGVEGDVAPLSAFPQELQSLGSTHVENFLCIYKDQFSYSTALVNA